MERSKIAGTFPGTNHVGVELMITDAAVGSDLSGDGGIRATSAADRSRLIEKALTAYQSIRKFQTQFSPDEEQKPVLDGRLTMLRARLAAAGITL